MEPLGNSIYNLYPKGGKLTMIETCQVGIEMIKVVRKLHDLGYIHRDLKSDNFMLKYKIPTSYQGG